MSSSSTVKEPFLARVQFTLSVAIQESYGAKDFLQSISGKFWPVTTMTSGSRAQDTSLRPLSSSGVH